MPPLPASLRSALPYYMPPKQRVLLRVYRAKVGRFQKYAILRALSSMKWGNTSKGWPMMGCDHAGRVPYSGRATVPRGAFLFREGVGGLIRGVTPYARRYSQNHMLPSIFSAPLSTPRDGRSFCPQRVI